MSFRKLITPESAVESLWLIWFVSWMAPAAWSDAAVARPAAGSEIVYRLLAIAGVLVLFGLYPPLNAAESIHWQAPSWLGWGMVAVATCGVAFAWWARIYLGRLWSVTITRKVDHHVVDTGPYGLVRHPIYTGLILSAMATAVIRGRASAFAGAALITLGWYVKARLEERFLREQLGRDAYAAYASRVPMLVPFTRG